MSRSKLQQAIGYAYKTVSLWENNTYKPKHDAVEKLSAALGVSSSWLMYGEERLVNYPKVYDEWLASPEGQRATPEEREWIKDYRSDRRPTVASLSMMLQVRRMELPIDDEY